MLRKGLVVVAAAALMATMVFTTPADAAKKAKKRSPASASSTSLDGRTLGYPRTCGFDYYQYDDLGAPMGPYCH
jgi:hypothetical protein